MCTKERYRPQRDSNPKPPSSESTTLQMSYPGTTIYVYVFATAHMPNLILKSREPKHFYKISKKHIIRLYPKNM